jgi:plasmid stability protein
MSTITIPLPDEDMAFLREYSATHGISAEAFLARQARNLREHLQRALQPEVVRATGVISPAVAGEEMHRAHLEKKHA